MNTQIINILNEILDEFYKLQDIVRILDFNQATAFGRSPANFYLNRVGEKGLIPFKERIACIVDKYECAEYRIRWHNARYVAFRAGRFVLNENIYSL
jgi:hypothetical protein